MVNSEGDGNKVDDHLGDFFFFFCSRGLQNLKDIVFYCTYFSLSMAMKILKHLTNDQIITGITTSDFNTIYCLENTKSGKVLTRAWRCTWAPPLTVLHSLPLFRFPNLLLCLFSFACF